jgi:hypothetical protein
MVLKYNKVKDLKSVTTNCIPLVDILDVKDNSFYNIICEMYTKYNLLIKDNIKKINSPSVNKNVLRNRVLIGNYTNEFLPISNNVYTDLHPVFYIFGLLLPYVSRILQVDMYGMFEQLANLSENRQLNDNELKLIKMTSMNDVKILDLDDTPLTYEQQVNVLIYLNMFLHVVTNSLFKLDRDSLPKMVEQSLMNQFNSIIETKYKLNSIYDKLHSNDPYHVKVIRKIMLSFGIRPVKLKLKNVPSNIKGMVSSINVSSSDDLEEFVDSISVPFEKIDHQDYNKDITYSSVSKKHLSLTKFLELYNKVLTVDNKLYWSQFNRAYGFFPLFINRKDSQLKKDYEQLLLANSECCEAKINTTPVDPSDIFCPYNDYSDNSNPARVMTINGVKYFPFAVMGVFLSNAEITGSIEDVEFLYINPSYENKGLLTSTDLTNNIYCPTIFDLLEKFDKEFFCGGKVSKNSYNCVDSTGKANSFDQLLSGIDNKCCDQSTFEDFQKILKENQGVGLLFTSNRSCAQPILVVNDSNGNVNIDGNKAFTTVQLQQIECLITSSVTTVLYITDIDC